MVTGTCARIVGPAQFSMRIGVASIGAERVLSLRKRGDGVERKAVALISGGLDSILAARVVMDQGYAVTGLYFTSAFSKAFGKEQTTHAAQVSRETGIELRIIDLGQEYIDLIRNPRHGYGKNSNPCIDCKIFMLQKARSVMEELASPFIITGEVLGQRPMSQRRDTLNLIERDAGLRGQVLRPLSAALLPPTAAEGGGLINRDMLLGISGRGRTVQLQLAERYGIRAFSTPAGGCLLTDGNFSDRLRDLFRDQETVTSQDVQLLTIGRHFRFDRRTKIVLGRDQRENGSLVDLAGKGYHLFLPEGFPGPSALLAGEPTPEINQAVGRLIITYSKKVSGQARRIRFGSEVFDPGDPLALSPIELKKVGSR